MTPNPSIEVEHVEFEVWLAGLSDRLRRPQAFTLNDRFPFLRQAAHGREVLFAVNGDSCHSTRHCLNGWSSRRRARRLDPELPDALAPQSSPSWLKRLALQGARKLQES